MRIYYEVLPSTLGKMMYRICKEIKENAPENVRFVNHAEDSDLQILDVVGTGSFEYLYKDNYILLQHCFSTAETIQQEYWEPIWKKAKLVASYHDLFGLSGLDNFNFLRIPWGVNPEIFNRNWEDKYYKVMTTGYVAPFECIGEVFEATKRSGNKMAHVGGKLFTNVNVCDNFENITDKKMNTLYNRSQFVAGMRKVEGFELPILEGLMCGARGITLDYPNYKYWYGDLVEYVKDGDFEYIVNQLVDIFKPSNYRPVTKEEINTVIEKFSWKSIAKTFWERIGLCT